MFVFLSQQSKIDPLSEDGLKPSEDGVKGVIEFSKVDFTYPARADVQVVLIPSTGSLCCNGVTLLYRF